MAHVSRRQWPMVPGMTTFSTRRVGESNGTNPASPSSLLSRAFRICCTARQSQSRTDRAGTSRPIVGAEMSASLDMSLDEIIRRRQLRRQRSEARGPGPLRRPPPPYRGPPRSAPYSPPVLRLSSSALMAPAAASVWRQEGLFGGAAEPEAGTKLYVSNLDYDVTNEDILLLFSDVGAVERCGIHYDRSGRSKGTAEVIFARHSDALAAIKRYNNVQLDGKPIKIEIVGLRLFPPPPPPPPLLPLPLPYSSVRRFQSAYASGQGSGAEKLYQGGSCQGRPRVSGPGKAHFRKPSAKELDAELDRYHLEAMQSSS